MGAGSPRDAWGRSGTRGPGAAQLGGEHFTSLWLRARGWCGQAMGVGLFSLVPVPVRGVRAWRWWWHRTGLLAVPSPLPWRIT